MSLLEEEVYDGTNIQEVIDPESDPEAPYGRKADGTPKKKPGRPSGSGGGSTGGTRKSSSSLVKLEEELADALGGDLAASIGTVSPLVAFVLDDRAERTARALSRIAGRSPRFRKGLEAALTYRDFLTLATLAPAIAAAAMVDFNMIQPSSQMARRFGLDKAWDICYGESGSEMPTPYVDAPPLSSLA